MRSESNDILLDQGAFKPLEAPQPPVSTPSSSQPTWLQTPAPSTTLRLTRTRCAPCPQSELAGSISHRFNNILMGVQGYLELLRLRSDPNPELLQAVSEIEDLVAEGAAKVGRFCSRMKGDLRQPEAEKGARRRDDVKNVISVQRVGGHWGPASEGPGGECDAAVSDFVGDMNRLYETMRALAAEMGRDPGVPSSDHGLLEKIERLASTGLQLVCRVPLWCSQPPASARQTAERVPVAQA